MLMLKLKQKIILNSTPGIDDVCDELETATEALLLGAPGDKVWAATRA